VQRTYTPFVFANYAVVMESLATSSARNEASVTGDVVADAARDGMASFVPAHPAGPTPPWT
jgi:hypothetical protein